MSSIVADLLRTMDDADRAIALEHIRAGSDHQTGAIATGGEMIETFCEAFGLDAEEVLTVALDRAVEQVNAAMVIRDLALPAAAYEMAISQACGGIVLGLRLGLMVAYHQDRAGG